MQDLTCPRPNCTWTWVFTSSSSLILDMHQAWHEEMDAAQVTADSTR